MRTGFSRWQQKVSDGVDRLMRAVSPKRAYLRQAYRFAYDALDGSRTRKPRSSPSGTGDVHLTESALSRLREICRDMGRNNPMVRGLLQHEADHVVGDEVKIEARSSDEKWNQAREQLWKEDMVDRPCEVTGRFNFAKSLNVGYYSYRRDGDFFCVFGEEGAWLCEGDQCGTPYGQKGGEQFDVTNGVATRRSNGRVIGYYIGRPDSWGYLRGDDYAQYTADEVQHVWNPDRISYTRGEPALTPAVDWIDKLTRYADAELVAAHVNAIFVMALTKRFPEGMLPGLQSSPTADEMSEEGFRKQKLGAGMIYECAPGEDAKAISAQHPTSQFDPFILRCLMFVGRCLCLPLMHVTLDYSGATYMNARIANQPAHRKWRSEQSFVVKPWASRWYLWRTERDIEQGLLAPAPEDWRRHEVYCQRWPYVDPVKEAQAEQLDLENGVTDPIWICASRGRDYRDVVRGRVMARKIERQEGLETQNAERTAQDEKETSDGSDGE